MILYKYRAFNEYEFLLDILLNERLYCSPYSAMNDPFEGLFFSAIHKKHPMGTRTNNPQFKCPRTVEDVYFSKEHNRICSLSSSLSDVRLWSYYAGGHTGVAIAIDFDGYDNKINEVKYSEKLPEFEEGLITCPSPSEVLSCKTSHWKYESEYRVITDDKHISIKDRIVGIYLGYRAIDSQKILLDKIINGKHSFYQTIMNKETVSIEAGHKCTPVILSCNNA